MVINKYYSILLGLIFGWNLNAHSKTYTFLAPEQGAIASDLASAMQSASSGDVFILSSAGGYYNFNQSVEIKNSIVIKSVIDNTAPIIQWLGDTAADLFVLNSGVSVEFIHVDFETEQNKLSSVFKTNTDNSENVSLITRHCKFKQASKTIIHSSNSIFADRILFESSYFENTALIRIDSTILDPINLNKLQLKNCIFTNYKDGLFFVPNNANVICASVLINHCAFDSIGTTDQHILNLAEQTNVSVLNSVFSNSSSTQPFIVEAGIEFDYCNFYHCNDLGNATGSNCFYYNPNYNAGYFVTNASLFNKGNDGENLGPLPWTYSEPDTIDTGDNPHGYANQGVWIQPTPDENGMWQSYFLKIADNGELTYRKDSVGNTIPDFSYVGYKRGQEPHPVMNVVATINPINGDATNYIQQVIDSVALNTPLDEYGCRGAILLKSGIYEIHGMLKITSDGIVLRGEGEGDEGTLLIATTTQNGASLINVGQTSGSLYKNTASASPVVVPFIPVGAKYVLVAKGHSFVQDDAVVVFQQMNNTWINELKMNQIPPRDDGGDVYQWVASDYAFNFERHLVRIGSGAQYDTLFFYNPLVMALDAKYSDSRIIYKSSFVERVQNCGVENMQLQSVYANATDEDHAWNGVYFNRAENCWAEQVTSRYFAYACANVSSYARYITVTHCSSLEPKSIITGGRRYSFNCDGQTSLFTYCYASEGRHDYVNGARVCGPNVFTHCVAEQAYEDIGPHHRWAMGTLFDRLVSDSEINVRDRSNFGTGHGWAGANQVIWNSTSSTGICQNPWASAKNYCIGFTGNYVDDKTFGDRPRGEWDGANVPGLNPASLYFAQKNARGAYSDFGLLAKEAFYINDSVFQLKFNQPIDTLKALNITNYFAEGNAGIYGNPKRIVSIDSITINMEFYSVGLLKEFSRIAFTVKNVISKTGLPITGWSAATLVVADQRPIIQMGYQEVTNAEDQKARVISSKSGSIYLVNMNITPLNHESLEAAVADTMASVAYNVQAGVEASLSTYLLPAGYYFSYALDADGRLSERSENWVKVSNPVGILNPEEFSEKPQIYWNRQTLAINLKQNDFKKSNLALFDMQGRILLYESLNQENNIINIPLNTGLYMVRISVDNKVFNEKIYIQQ